VEINGNGPMAEVIDAELVMRGLPGLALDKNRAGFCKCNCGQSSLAIATAFSIQVFTETWMQSGVFLKETPPCTISKWQHMNRKCSKSFALTSLAGEADIDQSEYSCHGLKFKSPSCNLKVEIGMC
jgi:hypothetical protein